VGSMHVAVLHSHYAIFLPDFINIGQYLTQLHVLENSIKISPFQIKIGTYSGYQHAHNKSRTCEFSGISINLSLRWATVSLLL